MKIMSLDQVAENETKVLTRLNHENVVKYYEDFEIDIGSNADRIKLCIITEFCEVLIFSSL